MRALLIALFVSAMSTTLVVKLQAEQATAPSFTPVVPVVPMVAAPSTPSMLPPPPPQPAETEVTIVIAGDTGLNGSFEPVFATFGTKGGQRLAWNEAGTGIASEINGDINFANLETVVTDRNDITAELKRFGFRTHPDGVRRLVALGFNAFSTANNHSLDFGLEGARETVKHMKLIGVAHAGIGLNRDEAGAPLVLTARGRTVAIGALGIIGSGYGSPSEGEERPGQMSYLSGRDFDEVTRRVVDSGADYKILSVHYGQEFAVATDAGDRRRLTGAIARGVDLVVGHHQHVVAGVENVDGRVVFYGLGNFLHWGTQDMGRFDICRDYGLVARLHLAARPGEKLSLRAIEAMPVTGMHKSTRRMSPQDGADRIAVLNHLAERLGPGGIRFATTDDGGGLYCAEGADRLTGKVGERCRAKPSITRPTAELAAKIETACSRQVVRTVENDELESEFEPVSADAELEVPLLP